MTKEKAELGNLWQRFIHTFKNFKQLYRTDRKEFYLVTTKSLFAILFYRNLFIPFYTITVFGLDIGFNITTTRVIFQIAILVLFFVTTLGYIFFAYEGKKKTANLLFQIQTIASMVVLVLFLIVFFAESSSKALSIGFVFDLLLITAFVLLTWKEGLVRKWLNRLFRNELERIGEAQVTEPETTPQPEQPKEQVEPAVKSTEPAEEPAEEPQEELVEESV